MSAPRPVALVLSYQFPGKYAFNVLGGAVEADPISEQVQLRFARNRELLLEYTRAALDAGQRVVVAWSFYSPSFPGAVEELHWLRSQLPDGTYLTLAGGVHATGETEQTLRAGFDLVAVGEGERTLLELLRRMVGGEDPLTTRGTSRLVDGRVLPNGRGESVNLDDHPPFAAQDRRFGAIEITRGCIYACRFCQTPFVNKARFRHRSPDNVARWVRVMRDHYKQDVRFITPTSLSYGSPDESVNLAAVEELLAKTREAIGPDGRIYFGTFPSEVRPEHVTPEALAVLRRYVNNVNLIIGGQSGSDRILAQSRRGHDVASILRAVRVCLAEGFEPNVDFIIGLPEERPEDVEATLSLMRTLGELGARVHGHTFMPLPGTPFRDAAPGQVSDDTRRELDRLASMGKLYGHWKVQAKLARELADRRPSRRA